MSQDEERANSVDADPLEREGDSVVDNDAEGSDAGTEEDSEAVDSDRQGSSEGDLFSTNIALFGRNIEILIGEPLPHLDRGPVKAYAARACDDDRNAYYALICEKHLVPRVQMAQKFGDFANASLVRVISRGIVFWPPTKEQRYAFIYENNLGRPLMASLDEGGAGWKANHVMDAVLVPLLNILLDFRDKDFFHGAICPTNIFDGGAKNVERVILGECLAVPPSYLQPVIMQPIWRAMADPIACGEGTLEDDLYSFGVSIAMILRTKDSMKGLSDGEIIQQKIEKGSYVALVGTERFPAAMIELMRGLLLDDRKARWGLAELDSWIDGQRLSPKQGARAIKASRPIEFNDKNYLWPVLLAMDMQENQEQALQMVNGGALEQWIDRSLEDKLTKGRLEDAVASVQGEGHGGHLLSRVSIALDPQAPLRFKGRNIGVEGMPSALYEAFVSKKDLQPFFDIIQKKLIPFWLNAQIDSYADSSSLSSRFDNCRIFLTQKNIGYGVERCLYFMCPDAPCLSEKLKGYYVRNPKDLLLAYEGMSVRKDRPHLFVDPHVAAFLSSKDRRTVDPYFLELNSKEEYKKIFGNIMTLATIQSREKMESLPGVARWCADLLDPLYKRYHDSRLRENIKGKIDKLAKVGDIAKMALILDNEKIKKEDYLNFLRAMKEYADLESEQQKVEGKLARPETFGKRTGQEVAAIFSAILSGIIILVFSFIAFSQNVMF